MPFGDWPKHPIYKYVGICNKAHYVAAIEGWSMVSYLYESYRENDVLTCRSGKPPWTVDEVKKYLAKLQAETKNPKYHLYQRCSRVWGQKPFEDAKTREA